MPESTPRTAPIVIGLIGGIAAGKSFVARAFESLGIECIDADMLAHEVLLRPVVARRLGQIFGQRIFGADAGIDRRKLSEIVFGDCPSANEARTQLEGVVHPLIRAAAVQQLRMLRESAAPPAAVVLDAPLLLEAGWEPMCDAILFIDTPFNERLKRVQARGWTEDQLITREAAQMPLQEKRAHATHSLPGMIDNQQLRDRLTVMLKELRSEQGKTE